MQVALAGVGIAGLLFVALGWVNDVDLVTNRPWLAALGAILVIAGGAGWVGFPRHALLVSVVTGVVFVVLGLGACAALLYMSLFPAFSRGVVAFAALLGGAAVCSFGGVTVGRALRRLRVVPRPAPKLEEAYRST